MIDLPVLKVNSAQKDKIQEEVVTSEGPTDGTVIISSPTGGPLDEMVEPLLEAFSAAGEVLVVRYD